MLYQIKKYVKFLLKSTNQHDVHSPFVYNLVTKCFYDKSHFDDYQKLRQYRKTLLKNKNTIEVTDLGAGSKVTKNRTRVISNIAKHVSSTKRRTELLYRLTNYFRIENILELGTSLGISTQAMSLGNPNAKITTIEGCPNISKISKENFNQQSLENIEVLTGGFAEIIQNLKHNTYDLIFIDGNHQKETTLNYFETLLQTINNESVFIFDDLYWFKDMTEAWEIIKQHSKVTVTIDTFYWGLVFFRKEQVKEHFTIRL
ncbi:MAG: class I SAM-dependent methyltransferase [Urechidicola sp.]|nr:class I SAM-dependent methyltransferase [Urechidicola sp.]